MTKESERKKIVEAIVSEGEIRERLETAGFEFKEKEDDESKATESKTKKKANI